MNPLPLSVASTPLELRPDRSLFWPAARTLIVSDLHWGKAESFQRMGIPMPGAVLENDLARLDRALDETGAERLLVLGDLVHAKVGLTPGLVRRIAAWRSERPLRLLLVRGNHDRSSGQLPESWRVEEVEELIEGPFCFRHEPGELPGGYAWAGHLHPACTLRGRGDAIRLPCFVVGNRSGILPAFSEFTGGSSPPRARGTRLFAVTGASVIEVR